MPPYAPPGSSYATVNTQTYSTTNGGGAYSYDCLYTMFGKWDEAQRRWVLVGFNKPSLMCM